VEILSIVMAALQLAALADDAVALARAWAAAPRGDDAEALGDALATAALDLPEASVGAVCDAVAARLDALTGGGGDGEDDDGCAAVLESLACGPLGRSGLRGDGARAVASSALARPVGRALGARAVAEGACAAALLACARRDGAPARAACRAVAAMLPAAARASLVAGDASASGARLAAVLAAADGYERPPTADEARIGARVAALVAPDAFWRDDWERRPCVLAADGSRARFDAFDGSGRARAAAAAAAAGCDGPRGGVGPTLGDIRALRAGGGARSLRSLGPLRETDPDRDAIDCAWDALRDPAPPPFAAGVDYVAASCARDGAGLRADGGDEGSVVILGADARFRIAREARDGLQRRLAVGCSVNVYATPPGGQALDAHYDDHCVFVAQLRGAKRWRLYGGGAPLPELGAPTSPPDPAVLRRGACAAVTLRPGDVLYVPRGVVHAATAANDGGEESVHVTVGVDLGPALTARGALHAALADRGAAVGAHAALKGAAADAPDLRRACLPALLGGVADADGRDAFAAFAAAGIRALEAAGDRGGAAVVAGAALSEDLEAWGIAADGDVVAGAAERTAAIALLRDFSAAGGRDPARILARQRAAAAAILAQSTALSAFYRTLAGA